MDAIFIIHVRFHCQNYLSIITNTEYLGNLYNPVWHQTHCWVNTCKIKALIRNRGGDHDHFCGTQAEDQFLTIVCPNILSSTFGRFLINIHILVKEKWLKSIKGEISQISSLTQFHFLLEKNSQERKQIYNGECFYPFSIRNTSHNIYCKYYHPGVPQCKIPVDNKPCSLMYLVQVQGLPPVCRCTHHN